MNTEITHINQLLEKALKEELYDSLIRQLNKDFVLANLECVISEVSTPEVLKQKLEAIVTELINNEFDSFLNLLYRVDLSEHKIRELSTENQDIYITSVSYLILKREWQKVWFRKNYS
ncbi:MAG: hypothetical protein HRT69_03295 [Flavobacteriaceae bacterium]|nr:hypothetical protein [Flavobacteriaceae bacterium]